MDVSDPQTLGFMVFGGFMVVSAIGIALVSTLSMKETSYEEALAKQRRQLVKAQQAPRADRKKKDKAVEKKSKAKKKEERADGKFAEPDDVTLDPVLTAGEPESEPELATEPEPEPESRPEPVAAVAPEPVVVTAPPPAAVLPPAAQSPKEKKKKKSAKAEPAPAAETVAKEVSVVSVAPVTEVAPVAKETSAAKTEEPKETPSKKKKNKTKPEPVAAVDSADSALLLPYQTLLASLSNTPLSPQEAHTLMEALSEKAGLQHEAWQLACQKGDALSAVRKQLEEKEKLMKAEQQDAAAAKLRLRELGKELAAEKSKMASQEARLKAELNARVQEVNGLQARMQTSHQDHMTQTQQLNLKVAGLQEQLENGPNAQLTRLQQENSILRDALNQATSQAESRQNAELARLRQEVVRLTREVSERSDALHADDERRKSLEAKMAAAEQQLSSIQLERADTERALQQQLDELSGELRVSQKDAAAAAELRVALASREAELQERRMELQALQAQLENQDKTEHQVDSSEVEELKKSVQQRDERVAALQQELSELQTQRVKEAENETAEDQTQKDETGSETESEQPFESLENDSELLRLEEELQGLRSLNADLQKKSSEALEAERLQEERLSEAEAARVEVEARFSSLQEEVQQCFLLLFPDQPISSQQTSWLEIFTQKAQESRSQAGSQQAAEESQAALQAECEQYRKLLAETEVMLHTLQRSVEEQEVVWSTKLSEAEQKQQAAEAELQTRHSDTRTTQQLQEQVMLLEAQLEKQLQASSFSQSCAEEAAQLRVLLAEAQAEAQRHREELSLVRQQMSVATERVQSEESESESVQVQTQLEQTTNKQQIEEEEEQQLDRDLQQEPAEQKEGTSV